MSDAMSPLPSPFAPWHIAQSKPYSFLPLASDSEVGFTGFALAAASGGTLYSGAGDFAGGGCCAHNVDTKKSTTRRTNGNFCSKAFLDIDILFFNAHLPSGENCLRYSSRWPRARKSFNDEPGPENQVWRTRFGYGRVSLTRALACAESPPTPPLLLVAWIFRGLDAPTAGAARSVR